MDLLELARTIQHDRDRSMEQTLRLRRLLIRRTDLPGPAAPEGRRPVDPAHAQVVARPGTSR